MGSLLRWIAVGFTSLILIGTLSNNDYLAAFALILAIAILIPSTTSYLSRWLPFLRFGIIQFLLWVILTIIVAPSISNTGPNQVAADCDQPNCAEVPQQNKVDIVSLMKARIGEYTAIPNLKEKLRSDVVLDGKLVVVNKITNQIEQSLLTSLGDFFMPKTLDEIKYIVWLECNREYVGKYTDGASGYQQKCKLSLIDRAASTLIARKTFTGGMPPQTKRYSGGVTGSRPDDQIRKYLVGLTKQN